MVLTKNFLTVFDFSIEYGLMDKVKNHWEIYNCEVDMMKNNKKKFNKLESDYLGPSDIVNQVGGQYVVKEKEMESALNEVMSEINISGKKKDLT
jgi:hypothetical protein